MSYEEEEIKESGGFKIEDGDEDEPLEPMEDGMNDFRFDEDTDDDPDNKYH